MTPQQIQASLKAIPKAVMEKIEKKVAMMKAEGDLPPKPGSATFKEHQVGDVHGGEADDRQPLDDHAQAALKAVARILAPHKDKISHDHVGAVMQELGMGAEHPGAGHEDGKVEMNRAIPENVEEEHHIAALGEAEKTYKSHLEKMGYRKYPDPSLEQTNAEVNKGKKHEDDDEDDDDDKGDDVSKVNKSAIDLSVFPEKQRAQLELIFKANTDLVEKNKSLETKNVELEKVVKSEKDQRVLRDFQERVRSFKHLGAKSDELAAVMKSMSEKLDPKEFEKIESVLKAADAQLEEGAIFGELGTRTAGTGNDSDSALDKLVDSYVAKGDGKESREEIYDRVCQTKEGKRLMAESINKNRNVR